MRDQRGHLGDVLGRPRQEGWRADAQVLQVGHEAGDVRRGQLIERHARGLEVANDPIVDIGDVHHPGDAIAGPLQVAAQHVAEQERAEVADVGWAVDGRPAAVHADVAGLDRLEILELAAEGVGQMQRHEPRIIADGR